MLCQNCKNRKAIYQFDTIINGLNRKAELCSECAGKLGYMGGLSPLTLNVDDFFGNFFSDMPNVPKRNIPKRCENCGTALEDVVHTGKVGCADCYDTFHDEILPSIERMHGKTKHEGKSPNQGADTLYATRKESELSRLEAMLKDAVEKEQFEKAAEYRDKIKEVEEQVSGDEE